MFVIERLINYLKENGWDFQYKTYGMRLVDDKRTMKRREQFFSFDISSIFPIAPGWFF